VLDIIHKNFGSKIDNIENILTNEKTNIKEDLSEISKRDPTCGWKFPNSFHITTFWVGKEQQRTLHENFYTFKEKIHFPFEITHVIYVPGML